MSRMVWVWLKFINRKFNNSVLIDCNFSKNEKTNLCTYLGRPKRRLLMIFLQTGSSRNVRTHTLYFN